MKEDVRIAKRFVEFAVDFQDGSSLLTTTALEEGGVARPPQLAIFRHPAARHPLVLKQKHDAHLRPLLARGARFYTAEQLPEVMEADHARKMEYNVERKRWRRLGDGNYALTIRNALRVVAQYLNPFSEQAWDLRAAIALVMALVPSFGTLALTMGQQLWLPRIEALAPGLDPATAWLLLFAPVVLLGSVALGLTLEARAVPWVFFFSLAENGALGPEGRTLFQDAIALGVVLVGVQAAAWISNFVNARRQLV